MVKMKKCLECVKEFEVSSFAKFKRRYCKECGVKRKKMWDEQWKVKFEDLDDE